MPDNQALHDEWRPSHNPYLVAITVTLATFMEVLDSSIANVALPHIAGSLGATYTEATWVLTSYLVSAAIVLPVSGWLSTVIGRKRFYMSCVVMFTVCSFLCGIAPTLPMLIVARILQGAGGGGLQPSEQAILADSFPTEKRGMAFALYGMAVVVAPAIGPTLGGWITDNFNWHWIFFINIPIGLLSLFLTSRMVEDPPWFKRERRGGIRIDYIGLALIVLGVSCLQVVLDKGQEDDWFASPLIRVMFGVGVPVLLGFFLWEWYHDDPIVDVRLLKNRNFGTAVFFSFILGMVLFGSTVLIPEFLQVSLGYTAQRAGEALSPAGFVLMLMMPIAGRLTASKLDPRMLISIGFLGTAVMLYRFTIVNLQIDFHTIMYLRMAQVVFMPLIFVPISTLNYVGVPREKNNQVSGLSNFARNLGGSMGTSLLSTFLSRQNQIHQVNFTAHTSYGDPNFQRLIGGLKAVFMSQGYDAVTAAQKALTLAYRMIQAQASTLSFENSFWVMSLVIAGLAPLPMIMRRPKPGERQTSLSH
ncbi:MAG TPA: DHA2 family efflux MFS transporter permease subunit [Bryobacteraceae bacterium]|jgi:DHA2 family multidrug resistance protein|nr:DHA2 family efflux MFS transporter permease subunit [Bryobacteraceae bacterium]